MGFHHKHHHHFTISILILLISTSLFEVVSGRKLPAVVTADNPETVKYYEEDKTTIWRAQIGSKPPRCERRCSSCEQCEAIQVPTSPKTKTIRAARAADNSNYKPMSWKCKCGNLIFNP